MIRKITSLDHEIRDNPVELASFKVQRDFAVKLAEACFTCAKLSEIFRGLWGVIKELKFNSASILIRNGYVKESSRVHFSNMILIGYNYQK